MPNVTIDRIVATMKYATKIRSTPPDTRAPARHGSAPVRTVLVDEPDDESPDGRDYHADVGQDGP
jgi:hypothetical protein